MKCSRRDTNQHVDGIFNQHRKWNHSEVNHRRFHQVWNAMNHRVVHLIKNRRPCFSKVRSLIQQVSPETMHKRRHMHDIFSQPYVKICSFRVSRQVKGKAYLSFSFSYTQMGSIVGVVDKRSPLTSVIGFQFPYSPSHVGLVCCWLLVRGIFSGFSSLHKN